MAIQHREAFECAVASISKHGDTDIFPTTIDKYVFFDRQSEVVNILVSKYDQLAGMPKKGRRHAVMHEVTSDSLLSTAGYSGFRWATQLDPIWNALLLGLVICTADDIEAYRVPVHRSHVFSYRYKWDATEGICSTGRLGGGSSMSQRWQKRKTQHMSFRVTLRIFIRACTTTRCKTSLTAQRGSIRRCVDYAYPWRIVTRRLVRAPGGWGRCETPE